MRLEDQVVIVTGGSRGIGKAVALEAAKEGAKVVVNYQKDHNSAIDVVEQIERGGGTAQSIKANIGDLSEVQHLITEATNKFGTVDILINNAGVAKDKLIFDMDPNDWKSVMDVNFGGVFNCTRAVAGQMAQNRKGSIVNISSTMSEGGWIGQSNYAASKAAINAFTRTAAVELARFKIRVNAILPGFSPTDMVSGLIQQEKRITKQIAQRRFGETFEIAKSTIFLASEDASHMTGSMMVVDGGTHCQIGVGKPL